MKLSLSRITDLLYPRRCALCDGILSVHEPFICAECASGLKFRKGCTCIKCGRPADPGVTVCNECVKAGHVFDEGFAPFAYSGSIKESIMRFKYHDRPEYARFFAAAILYYGKERIRQWDPDAIVPVPVHRTRLAERGYNQSLLISKEISLATGIPLKKDLVSRVKKTEAQKELSAGERFKNLKNAFEYTGSYKPPDKILIIDDIFTTGSTIDSLSVLFKERGTRKIFVVCVSS